MIKKIISVSCESKEFYQFSFKDVPRELQTVTGKLKKIIIKR